MKSHRPAYTLIECLVVIALIGTTLSTISLTIHGLQRTTRKVHDQTELAQSLDRFAQRLRDDAHAAYSVELVKDEQASPARRIRLIQGAGQTVEYSLEDGEIVRTVIEGEKSVHQDSYRIRLANTAEFQVDAQRERPLLSLLLEWHAVDSRTLPVTRIDASVMGNFHAQ